MRRWTQPTALLLYVLPSVAADPDQLLAWVSTLPGAQAGPIEIRKSRCGDGLGAFLTRAVQEDDVVFTVPTSAFLSLGTALRHPEIGLALRQLWECSSDGGVALLAALTAHLQLNSEEPDAYLRMLPTCLREQNHVLWWSDEEVALLAGTCAYDEAVSLRAEADAACSALLAGALAADVSRHGEVAVAAAVRAALVSVLSRSYGVLSDEGRGCKALVPVLDVLNHNGDAPTVGYSFSGVAGDEGSGGSEGLLVARSLCAQAAGDELLVSYGEQPDLIFGLHFGFVPAQEEARTLAELEAVRDELRAGAGLDARCEHADAVSIAARARLDVLERGEETSRGARALPSVRSCCKTLAQTLRQSERRVLQRLLGVP